MQVQHEQSNEEIIEALQRQVNELKASNLTLKEQLDRCEQFNAMVAHELRGPLTPIINYAELLAHPNLKPEAAQKRARIIISQARRLERLVNDLHDASRLSTRQFALDRAPCDIVALAREVVEQLNPVAPYHKFAVEATTAPVVGNWDAGRLQQVLGNLLDNAIKYSDEGTTITICISVCEHLSEQGQGQETKKVAHVSVHNQGIHIPPAEIGQLFRPYARLQSGSGHQGSGLGLYITKCIVDTHGGTLQLEPSTPEKPGTTFSFDLPM